MTVEILPRQLWQRASEALGAREEAGAIACRHHCQEGIGYPRDRKAISADAEFHRRFIGGRNPVGLKIGRAHVAALPST